MLSTAFAFWLKRVSTEHGLILSAQFADQLVEVYLQHVIEESQYPEENVAAHRDFAAQMVRRQAVLVEISVP